MSPRRRLPDAFTGLLTRVLLLASTFLLASASRVLYLHDLYAVFCISAIDEISEAQSTAVSNTINSPIHKSINRETSPPKPQNRANILLSHAMLLAMSHRSMYLFSQSSSKHCITTNLIITASSFRTQEGHHSFVFELSEALWDGL